MTDPVSIESRDYWFKVVEAPQQNWALIEPADGAVTVYFINETSGIFDELSFSSSEAATSALNHNRFEPFADASKVSRPPGPPFHRLSCPKRRIYSSGGFWNKMKDPRIDTDLPFFAYGIFKPGELAFLRIKGLVSECLESSISGKLLVRDGLPIFFPEEGMPYPGVHIEFLAGKGKEAYQRIVELEPEYHYDWKTVEPITGSGQVLPKANYLVGRSNVGCHEPLSIWLGGEDPLFKEALVVVKEVLNKIECLGKFSEFNLKPLFHLEMAYLLLWSSIERYASLRYHLGEKATAKIKKMADEPAFAEALLKYVNESTPSRSVRRADKPKKKETLKRDSPKKALDYYYQVRSNLVHRGKGSYEDYDHLKCSLDELLKIFDETREAAFTESQCLAAMLKFRLIQNNEIFHT